MALFIALKQSESITNIWHAIIGEDTGLPVFEREDDFLLKMADWINQPEITGINLPWSSIEKWKGQFR